MGIRRCWVLSAACTVARASWWRRPWDSRSVEGRPPAGIGSREPLHKYLWNSFSLYFDTNQLAISVLLDKIEGKFRLLITKSLFCPNIIKYFCNKTVYYFDICFNYRYTIALPIHRWKYEIFWSIFYFQLVSYSWGTHIYYLGLLIIFKIGYIYELIVYFKTKHCL